MLGLEHLFHGGFRLPELRIHTQSTVFTTTHYVRDTKGSLHKVLVAANWALGESGVLIDSSPAKWSPIPAAYDTTYQIIQVHRIQVHQAQVQHRTLPASVSGGTCVT